MSFTTKSESVPVVETFRSTPMGPRICQVALEGFGLEYQDIGTAGGEALILGHVVGPHSLYDRADVGNGPGRIGHVFFNGLGCRAIPGDLTPARQVQRPLPCFPRRPGVERCH